MADSEFGFGESTCTSPLPCWWPMQFYPRAQSFTYKLQRRQTTRAFRSGHYKHALSNFDSVVDALCVQLCELEHTVRVRHATVALAAAKILEVRALIGFQAGVEWHV